MRSSSVRFLLMTPICLIVPSVLAEGAAIERLVPFVVLDVATEKDAVSPTKNEYFNKHITVGVKTPKKWEYSLKLGTSDKDAQTYELMNNILEGKIKKSFELKKGFIRILQRDLAKRRSARRLSPTPLASRITVLTLGQNSHCPAREGLMLALDGGTRISTNIKVRATMQCCYST